MKKRLSLRFSFVSAAAALLATPLLLATGCSFTIERSFVREGFADDEALRLKRVIVALEEFRFADFEPEESADESETPAPELTEAATGELFLGMARDLLGQNSEYILLETARIPAPLQTADANDGANPSGANAELLANNAAALEKLCKRSVRGRKTEAVLAHRLLELEYDRKEGEVDLHLAAGLYDCAEKRLAWEVVGENEYDPEDSDLRRIQSFYAERHGQAAAVFVPAFFWMLREVYEELPDPVLTDGDIDDKIEFDAAP